MRRVPIGILLLIVTPSITQAYCFDVPLQCRTHYSPYAFSYRSNGLVPGGYAYTPYAFGFDTTGLAFEGLRYSPYAFGYSESGLVLDYCVYPVPYVSYYPPYPPYPVYREYQRDSSCDKDRFMPRPYGRRTTQVRRQDVIAVIRQHLRDKGIQNAHIDRILRIDNKLVSVDFTLADRNLLIKYWDPEQIESLSASSAFNRRAIEKYQQDWRQFAEEYQIKGGHVYAISVSDREDLVAALQSCDGLNPGDNSSDQRTMYAKN